VKTAKSPKTVLSAYNSKHNNKKLGTTVKISKSLYLMTCLMFSHTLFAQSNPHAGHGSGSSGSQDAACIKAKVSNFSPGHLASVKPGSAFSFMVSGSNGPGHIHVSIREQAIKLDVETKDTFYLVKGSLPADIKNETIRISVSAKSKVSKCDNDTGWLLKVSE
jgi:hypothetical protein